MVGGKLRKELFGSKQFKIWCEEAQKAGRAKFIDDADVKKETQKFERDEDYKSDDPHILALAKISGARLLFTNDRDLQQDFGNSELIKSPRGKIYTTRETRTFGKVHKNLLRRGDPCP